MPNILTNQYFNDTKKVFVPNAVSGNTGESENKHLLSIITEYERKLLLEVLGKEQYNQLQLELEKLPFNLQASVPAASEYQRLVNGYEEWQGIIPMLSFFVYCHWLEADEIKVGTVGSGKGQKEGYTIADRSAEYASRWNDFVEELEALREYLDSVEELNLIDEFPYYETINRFGL